MKASGHLMGANAVMGSKSMLVLLRGDRLGEFAVLDARTLAEKKSIKMPWCDAAGGDAKSTDAKGDAKEDKKAAPAKSAAKKTSDPEEGGQ